MQTSPNTQAILLLTSRFGGKGEAARPLTPTEWGRFAKWLHEQGLSPEHLFRGDLAVSLEGWQDNKVTYDRISHLLDRGQALALALEKWYRSNLWVLTRADARYPGRLKKRLGYEAPAVLYGCGDQNLINRGGLAVIGSRNAPQNDLDFTAQVGGLAAASGYSIVSGGARGVDQAAMTGALDAEGTSIGILADSLMKASNSLKYRRHLAQKNLLLITPFHPEAGFNVGAAMQRNKFIYCLADAALVVHSGGSGGTWTGAVENLKKRWVPLLVRKSDDPKAGNAALVNQGGQWLKDGITADNFSDLFVDDSAGEGSVLFTSTVSESAPSLEIESLKNVEEESTVSESTAVEQEVEPVQIRPEVKVDEVLYKEGVKGESTEADLAVGCDVQKPDATINMTLFDLFIRESHISTADGPKTPVELAESLQLHKSQVNEWLKRALDENKVKKLSKPVRYQIIIEVQQKLF